MIRRIRVTYHLELDPSARKTAERVHGFHQEHCPVARTIGNCVEITTLLEMEDLS